MQPAGLNDFGYKIFLDRYALKDQDRSRLREGAVVLVKTDNNTGQKEIGQIISLNDDYVDVAVGPDGEHMKILKEHVDIPTEWHPEDMWRRVAKDIASVEKEYMQAEVEQSFFELLEDWKFVPGGRILAGAGTYTERTFYNCFVLPSPKDSKVGIFETLNQMSQIMSRGGGVGINISTLRPRYAPTLSTNGRSSGAVSWSEIYSFVTGLIEMGGSRRGALMLILEDWHPDIEEFIEVKQDMSRILNANISVGISDRFMEAVENDEDWNFIFPDTSHPDYDKHWNGNIADWIDKVGTGYIKVHKTIKAKDLWHKLIESAWKCAEPGLWFKDRANEYSNSHYYAELICCNPCSEQPLPEWGTCLLGAINLSKYIDDQNDVCWSKLTAAIKTAVRFMDNVIDATPYFFMKNKELQQSERRLGLGTMGLAELLIRMKLRYGSQESLQFVDKLYKFIAIEAYKASIKLAMEKGAFPKFDANKFTQSGFVKRLPGNIIQDIRKYGIRNVTLLTQAPTGTTGTMVGTSTGIEPFYFWEYERKGRLGSHKEVVKVYQEYCDEVKKKDDNWEHTDSGIPGYFVTAQDLTPEEHVKVQATIQRWVDSSISKTCNVPESYTVEQTKELYELMYKLGCKGGTIYRDKSRDIQVLNLKDDKDSSEEAEKVFLRLNENIQAWRKRPVAVLGTTYRKQTPAGNAYITINEDNSGPFEAFVNVGKAGSEVAAEAEAIGRLISFVLRMPSSVPSEERLKGIVSQLKGIGSGRQLGFGKNRVMSLPDGIAQALEEFVGNGSYHGLPEEDEQNPIGDICPSCGNASFVRIEGCQKCFDCGHSEC